MKVDTKALMKSAKFQANKLGFFFKKNSPQILTGLGIAGGVTATVMACKATLKLPDIMEAHNEHRNDIREFETDEKAIRKDMSALYLSTGIKVVRIYAPAAFVGGMSITSILYGHKILSKRNASLVAAYKLLDEGFKQYRQNVVDRFGEDVDRELRYNLEKKKVIREETDENGKTKKVKEEILVAKKPGTPSIYARFFDENNKLWEKDPELNRFFIQCQQEQFNNRLIGRGYVFLNEVYEALGFEPTKAGQHVGWIYDPKNKNGDSYINFGMYDIYKPDGAIDEAKAAFINGYERSILLDFNVQGPIDTLIGEEI